MRSYQKRGGSDTCDDRWSYQNQGF